MVFTEKRQATNNNVRVVIQYALLEFSLVRVKILWMFALIIVTYKLH